MEVEIISREVIKPSSPTPPHLRLHNLSFFDQFIPSWCVPVLLFYSNKELDDLASYFATKRLHLLKTSLSETLVRYYPLAGSIGDSESIECNDEGAVIWEARANCGLSEILKHPENETLDQLLPDDLQWTTNSNIPLVIQVTFFDCGGMAIGFCLSHRILDMSSMGKFINNWANTARGTGDHQNVLPDFSAATLFPRGDLPVPPPHKLPGGTVVTRSWCWIPVYQVDFGWGRPEWVTTTSNGMKNSILLMDTRDGLGIEALVTLEEQDMAVFERDDELLSFATVNPGAVEAATT
ncbi:stemmadenine O-acetyltransferase-like [Pistacia vera]|uniref:stemmadenine O-acetyltransferase-like n=1 Tax=Pistacia vera TaxID=55513 RepID=UPI0012630B72|nr:stemmadenine O-acetyltransferase-like [Pistacia vera]